METKIHTGFGTPQADPSKHMQLMQHHDQDLHGLRSGWFMMLSPHKLVLLLSTGTCGLFFYKNVQKPYAGKDMIPISEIIPFMILIS